MLERFRDYSRPIGYFPSSLSISAPFEFPGASLLSRACESDRIRNEPGPTETDPSLAECRPKLPTHRELMLAGLPRERTAHL